jgi:hypothetical protein
MFFAGGAPAFAKSENLRLNRFWAFLRAGGYKSSDKIS